MNSEGLNVGLKLGHCIGKQTSSHCQQQIFTERNSHGQDGFKHWNELVDVQCMSLTSSQDVLLIFLFLNNRRQLR